MWEWGKGVSACPPGNLAPGPSPQRRVIRYDMRIDRILRARRASSSTRLEVWRGNADARRGKRTLRRLDACAPAVEYSLSALFRETRYLRCPETKHADAVRVRLWNHCDRGAGCSPLDVESIKARGARNTPPARGWVRERREANLRRGSLCGARRGSPREKRRHAVHNSSRRGGMERPGRSRVKRASPGPNWVWWFAGDGNFWT